MAAVAWPLAARAQQPGKLPTIGYLGSNTRSLDSQRLAAFVERLREQGWIENRTVAIEYRWGEGRDERFAEVAADFIRLKVDVIVTSATPSAIAAKKATAVIPIVIASAGDPVAPASSLHWRDRAATSPAYRCSKPILPASASKCSEILPSLRTLAILANTGSPNSVLEMREAQATARTLGLDVVTSEVRRAEDIAPAFEALKGRADALYVSAAPLLTNNRIRINTLALGVRLPTMHTFREYVEAGGLISYGPNFQDLFRRAAEYVDKILRGAKPGDLPVEQPTKFDLVLNLTTRHWNALVMQYQRLFEMESIDLTLADEALGAIARKAIDRKTGARGCARSWRASC